MKGKTALPLTDSVPQSRGHLGGGRGDVNQPDWTCGLVWAFPSDSVSARSLYSSAVPLRTHLTLAAWWGMCFVLIGQLVVNRDYNFELI